MILLLCRAIVVESESIDPGVGVQLNAHLSSDRSAGQRLEVDGRFMFVEVRFEGNIDRRRRVAVHVWLGQEDCLFGNLR